jgi:hypothetical protein
MNPNRINERINVLLDSVEQQYGYPARVFCALVLMVIVGLACAGVPVMAVAVMFMYPFLFVVLTGGILLAFAGLMVGGWLSQRRG